MKNYQEKLLSSFIYLTLSLTCFSNPTPLQPFEGCPGTSVIISRPGNNSGTGPYQIYLVTPATGAITPSGNPINLQINGFGLNVADGFLYGIHESSNVSNPFFTRVDKNGAFENLGFLLGPPTGPFAVGVINTAAGTIDQNGNYYFTAVTLNLQNQLEVPHLFVGKVENIASLTAGSNPIPIIYTEIALGTCADELLALLMNPVGALQDIAYFPGDGQIYTYFPTAGKVAHFNPNSSATLTCMDPPLANPLTTDLAGIFTDPSGTLFILTTDGKYYTGNINTGVISLVTQTTLPLISGNLRGDMASCVGGNALPTAFDNCPGASVIVSRPGINATVGPYQIYEVDPPTGNITATGTPINHEINGFGLNSKDGFLYAMHESTNVNDPFFTRVGKNGITVDLGKLTPPPATAPSVGIINTAGGTMDPFDNYFFTAVTADNANFAATAQLFMGKIANVSTLVPGSPINVTYVPVALGPCGDEFALQLANPGNGLLQDFAYNPANDRIYFYVPEQIGSPSSGKIGSFNVGNNELMFCLTPQQPNPQLANLAGIFFGPQNILYILTTDGKYYAGNIFSGVITEVTQTQLPLISGNLRGDMASCVKKVETPTLPTAFDNCPGASVIVSRPGINATVGPYQIYEVDPPTGNITATGTPINHEINGFGLNSKDGFLYAMHESTNVNDPFFTRVGKNGITVDLGKLTPPPATAPSVGIINTAGGTMDPFDNYFFTAVTADNANFAATAQLFMGKIANVSTLVPGSPINVTYVPVALGPCGDEFALQLANPGNGLLQDFAYNPANDRIYFYVPEQIGSPSSGKIGSFNVGNNELMFCLTPQQPNPQLANLAGIFFGPQNILYILTTDGKYYAGNIFSGVITEVTQTQLPLISGNLRGDMASCVKKVKKHHLIHHYGDNDDEDDDHHDSNHHFHMSVSPNPAQGHEIVCSVESDENVQVELILVDAYSRIAQRKLIRLVEGSNKLRIDVLRLMKGFSSIMLIYPTGRRESIKFIRM